MTETITSDHNHILNLITNELNGENINDILTNHVSRCKFVDDMIKKYPQYNDNLCFPHL